MWRRTSPFSASFIFSHHGVPLMGTASSGMPVGLVGSTSSRPVDAVAADPLAAGALVVEAEELVPAGLVVEVEHAWCSGCRCPTPARRSRSRVQSSRHLPPEGYSGASGWGRRAGRAVRGRRAGGGADPEDGLELVEGPARGERRGGRGRQHGQRELAGFDQAELLAAPAAPRRRRSGAGRRGGRAACSRSRACRAACCSRPGRGAARATPARGGRRARPRARRPPARPPCRPRTGRGGAVRTAACRRG